jgi:serine/threonine protein kinase
VTDFGLARALQVTGLTTPALLSGTLRYQAPELMPADKEDEPNPRVTKETDVWSFSMTVIEVRISRSQFFATENGPLAGLDRFPAVPLHQI